LQKKEFSDETSIRKAQQNFQKNDILVQQLRKIQTDIITLKFSS